MWCNPYLLKETTVNDALITIMLFCATIVTSMGSIAAVTFLLALTREFLSDHFGIGEE